MLIRLLREIAQGSRLLLDLLAEGGRGREEEVLHDPKNICGRSFCKCDAKPELL